MKKAQGLPVSTIVLAIIGLLVLFVLIAFFTGGFSKVFGQAQAATGSTEAELSSAQTRCAQWCLQAQGLATDAAKISSNYCTRAAYNTQTNKMDAVPLNKCATKAGIANTVCCEEAPVNAPCESVNTINGC